MPWLPVFAPHAVMEAILETRDLVHAGNDTRDMRTLGSAPSGPRRPRQGVGPDDEETTRSHRQMINLHAAAWDGLAKHTPVTQRSTKAYKFMGSRVNTHARVHANLAGPTEAARSATTRLASVRVGHVIQHGAGAEDAISRPPGSTYQRPVASTGEGALGGHAWTKEAADRRSRARLTSVATAARRGAATAARGGRRFCGASAWNTPPAPAPPPIKVKHTPHTRLGVHYASAVARRMPRQATCCLLIDPGRRGRAGWEARWWAAAGTGHRSAGASGSVGAGLSARTKWRPGFPVLGR